MRAEDLILASDLAPGDAHDFLRRFGFRNPETAPKELQAGRGFQRRPNGSFFQQKCDPKGAFKRLTGNSNLLLT
jgi:hypothetical protein